MNNADQVEISGYRFQRSGPGEYRYKGWAASAVLTIKPLPGGAIVELGYAVEAKW